jgi:hypothetical protein
MHQQRYGPRRRGSANLLGGTVRVVGGCISSATVHADAVAQTWWYRASGRCSAHLHLVLLLSTLPSVISF